MNPRAPDSLISRPRLASSVSLSRVPVLQRFTLPLAEPFIEDRNPAYYGRYRLWFDQVAPRFDVYRALIKVRVGAAPAVAARIDQLARPSQCWPFQLINRAAHARAWSLPPGLLGDDFLSLEPLSDICYIDMRNFRAALSALAPHLDDAHFFVLSTGDGLDRWVDEYRLEGGVTTAERWLWQPDLLRTRIDLYHALSRQRRDDAHFREFVAFCCGRANSLVS